MIEMLSTNAWFAVVLVVLGLIGLFLHNKKSKHNLPPMAPSSLLENMVRSGYPSLPHKVEMSEWVCDNTDQDTSKGATFSLSMPLLHNFFVTCDYQLMRLVLSGSHDPKIEESDKSPRIKSINLIPGVDSILTSSTQSKAHSTTRKFMAPAFSTMNLQKTTLGILRTKTADYIQKLRSISDSDISCVDMKELNVKIIFEILTESLFDLKLDKDLSYFDCDAFLAAQNSALREGMKRSNIPFRSPMFWKEEVQVAAHSEKFLRELGATVLRKHREKVSDQEKDGSSIISHLISYDYPTEDHRISDLIVFLIAGHETTSHSLSFFLYCMAKNDSARAKLQQELDAHLPLFSANPSTSDLESISPSAISQLEYFSWCLKESQRLYPVAPAVGRQLQQDLQHNGYTLPKNSVVVVHLYAAGRQRWIEDADQFKPERWSKSHHQYDQLKQIPSLFSLGKRSCIGQNLAMLEMRVLAAHLMRNFNFKVIEEPDLELFVTMKPIELKMEVTKRDAIGSSAH